MLYLSNIIGLELNDTTMEIKPLVVKVGNNVELMCNTNIQPWELQVGILTWNITLHTGKTYTYSDVSLSYVRNTYSWEQNLRYYRWSFPKFLIKNVQMIDAGVYSCIINGTVINTINLIVMKDELRSRWSVFPIQIAMQIWSTFSYNTFDKTNCYANGDNVTILRSIFTITELEKVQYYELWFTPNMTLECGTNVSQNYQVIKVITWNDVFNALLTTSSKPTITPTVVPKPTCQRFEKKIQNLDGIIYGLSASIAVIFIGTQIFYYAFFTRRFKIVRKQRRSVEEISERLTNDEIDTRV